jgi:hypothetical protein
MVSWPKQVQDDLSKWEVNDAGDPEEQADSRSGAFDWAQDLQDLDAAASRRPAASRRLRNGTQEALACAVPALRPLPAAGVEEFPGQHRPRHPEKAHFTCASCGCVIEHKHKAAIVRAALWVADNPPAKEPSFHIWRAYAPTYDWESIAREWLRRRGRSAGRAGFSTTCSASNSRARRKRRPGRISATAPTASTTAATRCRRADL